MENKENKGSIFKNNFKKSDTHPDYKGNINVDGKEKEISLWVKTQKDGTTKYFSASISEPYKKPESKPAAPQQEAKVEDDLPF